MRPVGGLEDERMLDGSASAFKPGARVRADVVRARGQHQPVAGFRALQVHGHADNRALQGPKRLIASGAGGGIVPGCRIDPEIGELGFADVVGGVGVEGFDERGSHARDAGPGRSRPPLVPLPLSAC